MASWGLLDEREETEIHKYRLLNVEEKAFKRVTKRLSQLHSLATSKARQTATPPPETSNTTTNGAADNDAISTPATTTAAADSASADLAQLREDITLDFAAFDSSITRLQFLLTANERERERYAAERERILNTAQAVRDNTAQLRVQLDQARATLEQRKKFDELADKITSNPSLRTRTEQASNLRKLEEEIAELEAESKTYGITWHERRDQFAKIMEESMRLRRLIRDEKEEVERREGMDEGEAGDGDGPGGGGGGGREGAGVGTDAAGQTPRPSGIASGHGTPRPESGLLPKSGAESGDGAVGTPRPGSTTGGRTPARGVSPAADSQSFLKPSDNGGGSFSQAGSQGPSREPSVERERGQATDGGDDVEMGEVNKDEEEEDEEPDSPLTPVPSDDPPQIVVDGEEDKMDTT